jgi:hypothetical protein
MNISSKQIRSLQQTVSAGLRVLFRPVPVCAVEWANENYYLPKESSYQEGRWETLPFQVAIMNAMGSDDKDISKALRQCLQELTLTDNGGATGKADELQITLISETLPLPSNGARLQLGLGFNGNLVDKGWFVVSGVSSSGPPRKVVIYATAAPMNAQKQSGNVQSHKTRSWDNLTLGDIVKTVATDNGLIPKVAPALAAIAVSHLDQASESDANLLTRLARSHNAVSKPSGGYWLFLEQGAALTASGKTLADVTIVPREVSNWTYSEGQRGSTTGKPSSGGKEKKGKIGVNYYDEDTGQTKVAQTEHDGPDLENPYTQSHKAQADQQAKAKKTQATPIRYRHSQYA